MKQHVDNNQNKKSHATFIWSLLIGTTTLFVGLAIGLTIRTPLHATSVVQEKPVTEEQLTTTYSQQNSFIEQPAQDIVFDNPSEQATDPIEMTADEDETVLDTSDHVDDAEPDTGTLARREELQYLKEVLPDNLMIPTEKTAAEVDALFAEFEENRQLQERIEKGEATPEEKERYYDLRMKKYDEEIALINLCQDVAANSLASSDERQAQLCSHMAESSAERLQVINESIEELQQQILFSSRGE